MQSGLLKQDVQDYIDENLNTNVVKLSLKKQYFENVDFTEIINQIVCKNKSKTKLPTWFKTKNIIYPSKISIEQTSSEITAQHKANLVSGKSMIDLTGGFGIDTYYFSKKINEVIHCEINTELSQIAAHNFDILKAKNIQCVCENSSDLLKKLNRNFDWIYIDPSRRNDNKGKVFMLEDCLPDVPGNLNFYFEFTDKILIKTAPILDISAGLQSLDFVKKIEIIAVENEVKELLWILEKNHTSSIEITSFNYSKTIEKFNFFPDKEITFLPYELPQKYLYEPNSAVMKSGGFNAVSQQFKIAKLHAHSHLYTSDELIDFPGRKFEIITQIKYQKQTMKSWFEGKKYNITTRNFPETVESIRKKWKIKDGGDNYCFFTTDKNNHKIVLICTKI